MSIVRHFSSDPTGPKHTAERSDHEIASNEDAGQVRHALEMLKQVVRTDEDYQSNERNTDEYSCQDM